jgi:hypothetical protein
MRLSNDPLSRLSRLLFTAVLVIAWCRPPAVSAQEAPDPADLRRQIEAAEKNLPRETFDPAAVVRQTGREPVKLFEWVRQNTSWVPYVGCLRGPRGVLMDGVGSNLDRALLLAELLRTAGFTKVRLARATLTEAQARQLVAASPPPIDPAGNEAAAPAQPPAVGAFQPELDRMAEDVAAQGASLGEAVVAALGDAPAEQPSPEPWQALADHWWVQCEQDGKWVDYDPALPDARPASRIAGATATFDVPDFSDPGNGLPAANPSKSALPAELWHVVLVRVVVEQWRDGRPREAVALARTLRPAVLHGHRVVLHHFPIDPPPQPTTDPESTDLNAALRRYKASVLATREWYPMLEIGGAIVGDASVNHAGDLNPNPSTEAIKGTGKAVKKAIDDAFDVLSPEPPPAAPAVKPGVFGAEWVEYEIRSPGLPVRKVRRQVFDLLGPAARAAGGAVPAKLADEQSLDRALALAGRSNLLVLGANPSPAFVQQVLLDGVRAHLDLLPEMARPSDRPMSRLPDQAMVDRLNKVSPPQGPLYGLALVRHLWSPHRGRIYLDRPNVLAHHAFVRRGAAQGAGDDLLMCEAMDVVANDVAVRPAAPGAEAADARRVRLEQGVFDTVAETAFALGCGKPESAAGTLGAAKDQGIRWVTVRGPQDPAWKALDLPPDARARIERDLADGLIVIVPERPPGGDAKDAAAVAWWRIDPSTGTALGMGRNGWGPNMVERGSLAYYLITASEAVKEIKFLACAIMATAIACCIACVAMGDAAAADAFYKVANAAKKGCA